MSENELRDFLSENKRKFEKAMADFDKHSLDFDRKIGKLLSKI